MKRSHMILIAMLALVFVLSGCAVKGTAGKEVPSVAKMETHPQDDRALLYVNADAPKKLYSKFIIEPVQIYQGQDHGFADISMEDRRMMADFTREEMIRVLDEKYAIVDKPGPGTMRIRLILVGLEKTSTVLRGLTYGNPMGLAMNLGKGALGKQGNFMGSITLAGEFEDSLCPASIIFTVGCRKDRRDQTCDGLQGQDR
jgi:predicted small secreted protein